MKTGEKKNIFIEEWVVIENIKEVFDLQIMCFLKKIILATVIIFSLPKKQPLSNKHSLLSAILY